MPHQSTDTATVLAQSKHTECTVPKHYSGIGVFIYKMFDFKVEGEKKYVMEAGVQGVCELSLSLSLCVTMGWVNWAFNFFGLGC